jgi:hypothetical protein
MPASERGQVPPPALSRKNGVSKLEELALSGRNGTDNQRKPLSVDYEF